MQIGQVKIQHGDIRTLGFDDTQRDRALQTLPNHLEVRLRVAQRRETFPYQCQVVGKQDRICLRLSDRDHGCSSGLLRPLKGLLEGSYCKLPPSRKK